jgi:hypothetical protein
MVVPYGANWVDGDTVVVTGTTFTFKLTAPDAGQFNSKASLIALIAAETNHDCVEFGTHLAVNVATGHLLIYKTAAGGADGDLEFSASTLNPQACPYLRNAGGTQTKCDSRGSGADEAVVWSPYASGESTPIVVANDATAQATLVAGGYRPLKNLADSGCCDVIGLGTGAVSGGEELRWWL